MAHVQQNMLGCAFSTAKTIDSEVGISVHTADLTGNGSPDVIGRLYPSSDLEQVAWYENTSDALPVELASIEGTWAEGGVVITWHTASEQNNAGFEVQREASEMESQNEWKQIGFVEGTGSTQQAQSYRFKDTDLPFAAETLRYRLRQEDTDGSSSLSPVVSVARRSPSLLALQVPYPNPTPPAPLHTLMKVHLLFT